MLEPERAEFRRCLEELRAYRKAFGDVKVPYAYTAPSGHRLEVWVADQRRYKAADVLDPERVKELAELGMVWSAFDTAFTDNLTAVAGYAAEHGHACPPNEAVWGGRPVGTIMKNLRTAQRRTEALQRRAEAGETGLDRTGALTADRKNALDAIDHAWCPTWSVEWQRCFALARRHIKNGGTLAGAAPGSIMVQGEDLAGWGRAQQVGWDKLAPAQQWALENVLGIEPLPEEEKPAVKVSHTVKEQPNLAAAAEHGPGEGHLNVPRKHKEPPHGGDQPRPPHRPQPQPPRHHPHHPRRTTHRTRDALGVTRVPRAAGRRPVTPGVVASGPHWGERVSSHATGHDSARRDRRRDNPRDRGAVAAHRGRSFGRAEHGVLHLTPSPGCGWVSSRLHRHAVGKHGHDRHRPRGDFTMSALDDLASGVVQLLSTAGTAAATGAGTSAAALVGDLVRSRLTSAGQGGTVTAFEAAPQDPGTQAALQGALVAVLAADRPFVVYLTSVMPTPQPAPPTGRAEPTLVASGGGVTVQGNGNRLRGNLAGRDQIINNIRNGDRTTLVIIALVLVVLLTAAVYGGGKLLQDSNGSLTDARAVAAILPSQPDLPEGWELDPSTPGYTKTGTECTNGIDRLCRGVVGLSFVRYRTTESSNPEIPAIVEFTATAYSTEADAAAAYEATPKARNLLQLKARGNQSIATENGTDKKTLVRAGTVLVSVLLFPADPYGRKAETADLDKYTSMLV
ncbi:helicase associated domain-containing protein [Kitasatospora sp. A2-31]|uniref:helicase associated domain-containing protein n=1 Tax=Kitasatospora sp. A2-31 TaxID=2916414 RepID=UPI001EEE95F6|nr:helicase associated domain-containing protein [Kitasatospora sp. A2-31]MCG6499808.1 helicase associated domain-containing protein [Kitasatospora sp. A2-31]MCG6500049.1 helicase associated domain-containing protein [Kitasatospora sp. A2-31]